MYYTIDGKYINSNKLKNIEKFNNSNRIIEHNTESNKCIDNICISENDIKIIKSNNDIFMKDALDIYGKTIDELTDIELDIILSEFKLALEMVNQSTGSNALSNALSGALGNPLENQLENSLDDNSSAPDDITEVTKEPKKTLSFDDFDTDDLEIPDSIDTSLIDKLTNS